jgi:hypothetical protein
MRRTVPLSTTRRCCPPCFGFGQDDCGFAPFADDASTSREIAFEKIRARVAGTALAAERLA